MFTEKYCELTNFEKLKVNEMPNLIIECIGSMIRYNTNLQCINLDGCGLNSKVLAGFVPFLRHSKSLLCFHLAQNPGITKEVKEFWRRRLHTKPKEHDLAVDVKRDRDDFKRPLTIQEK